MVPITVPRGDGRMGWLRGVIIPDMEGYGMRGTYEAYILVEVKDGRQFVCALNRWQRKEKAQDDTLSALFTPEQEEFRENQVIWN